VYQPNKQVTDAQIDGYGSAFEYRQSDVQFAGIRGGRSDTSITITGRIARARDAQFPGKDPIPTLGVRGRNYTEHYEDGRYMATTRTDRLREVALYDGLRYGERAFGHLTRLPA